MFELILGVCIVIVIIMIPFAFAEEYKNNWKHRPF